MASERDEQTGRFVGGVPLLELYEVVRQVALLATLPGYDPRLVTMDGWNGANATSEWAEAPDARDICRGLRPRGRAQYPWQRLLVDVFSGHSFERIHTERQSVADDVGIAGKRIRYRCVGSPPSRNRFTSSATRSA
jgi:hypothetical protein